MAKFMKSLAIIVLVLSFIMTLTFATVAGNFSWQVFGVGVLSCALLFGLLYSIGVVIDLLARINGYLSALASPKHSSVTVEQTEAPYRPVHPQANASYDMAMAQRRSS